MGCGMSKQPRERLYYSERPGDSWDAQYAAHRQGVRNMTSDPRYQAEWKRRRSNNTAHITQPIDQLERSESSDQPVMHVGIERQSMINSL